MNQEAQIIFRGINHSDVLEQECLGHIARLEEMHDRITSCRVTLAEPHHAHGTGPRGKGPSGRGHRYEVTIDLILPGNKIIVKHHSSIEDPPVGITPDLHHAFMKAKSQLESFLGKRRRAKEAH